MLWRRIYYLAQNRKIAFFVCCKQLWIVEYSIDGFSLSVVCRMIEFLKIIDEENDMTNESMIVITGAAGLIGSGVVRHLNDLGRENLLLVDDLGGRKVEKSGRQKVC